MVIFSIIIHQYLIDLEGLYGNFIRQNLWALIIKLELLWFLSITLWFSLIL